MHAEPTIFNCSFEYNIDNNYSCRLNFIQFLDPTQDVIFGGEHLDGKSNSDVEAVSVSLSNTPNMIPQMFTTFPNMIALTTLASQLQSISIPDATKIIRLNVDVNRIGRIEKGMLNNQRNLQSFSAMACAITSIDEDAFEGLDEVTFINFQFNMITKIEPKTFQHLPNLLTAIFESNALTRIDDDVFSKNTKLRGIFLANNQINEISPKFSRAFLKTIENIDLTGNSCVQRLFRFNENSSLVVMNNMLNLCFNNFNGGVAEERRITKQFKGSMAMYDEFGNIVGRVN